MNVIGNEIYYDLRGQTLECYMLNKAHMSGIIKNVLCNNIAKKVLFYLTNLSKIVLKKNIRYIENIYVVHLMFYSTVSLCLVKAQSHLA